MVALEADARASGHRAIGVRASLNAIPFYAALGYRARAVSEVPLGDGLALSAALMAKSLAL
jgi:pantoate kinase